MSWNTLTTEQITNEILPDEVAILYTIQGSSTILAAVMASCVAEIQAVILNAGNQIGPAGTVPDQILRDVIPWVIWEWFSGLSKTDLQSDARKERGERWGKRMLRIQGADGHPPEKIEIPSSPQNVTGASLRVETVRPGRHVRTDSFDKMGES